MLTQHDISELKGIDVFEESYTEGKKYRKWRNIKKRVDRGESLRQQYEVTGERSDSGCGPRLMKKERQTQG